jgi:hypothetical protein
MKTRGKNIQSIDFAIDGGIEIKIDTRKYGLLSVLIDEEDLTVFAENYWTITKPKRTFYVVRPSSSDRPTVGLHRLILGNPVGLIDHIDHNGLDNRRRNLRLANSSQSAANRRLPVDASSGFKGVTFVKKKNLYAVQLLKDGKHIHGGHFKNILLAAAKYNELAIVHHGEFACLNEFTDEQVDEINNPPKETRRISKNNKTGYIGVSFRSKGGFGKPYIATIYIGGKNKSLGVFADAKSAAEAYNEAAIKYHGEKAALNDIK